MVLFLCLFSLMVLRSFPSVIAEYLALRILCHLSYAIYFSLDLQMMYDPKWCTFPLSLSSLTAGSVSVTTQVHAIVLLNFHFRVSPQVIKMRLLGRGLHTLIKNVSFSSRTDVGSHNPPPFALVPFSNQCGTSQSAPLRGPASLLAHCLVSTPSGLSLLASTLPGVWL